MEQSPDPPHDDHPVAAPQPPACGPHSKRLKELENAALQNTLISRMDTEAGAEAGGESSELQAGHKQRLSGSSPELRAASSSDAEAEAEAEGRSKERAEEERTLTDHLNKRLLSSFLEKLNQRDLALPGVGRLDCAVADEDSNKAADEW